MKHLNFFNFIADILLAPAALLLLVTMTGCATRETAKATQQADQAMEGAQARLVGPVMRAAVSALTPDQAAAVDAALQPVLDLLTQGRESLAPALSVLGKGKPIETETSAQMAAERPTEFIRRAQRQAARAAVEAESLAWWRDLGRVAATLAGQVGGSSLATGLLGAGGLATVIAGLLKVRAVIATGRKVQEAMADYARDAAQAVPGPAMEAVKDRHRKAQEAAGIHAQVVKVVRRVKATRGVGSKT